MRWQPQPGATPPSCRSCPWKKNQKQLKNARNQIYTKPGIWTSECTPEFNPTVISHPIENPHGWRPLLTILIPSIKIKTVRKVFSWQQPEFCTLPILCFHSSSTTWLLRLFKNQNLWKTLLVYREEKQNYTTFTLFFCPPQNQSQPQIAN